MGYNPFRVLREMHSTGGGMTQFYGGYSANLIGRLQYLFIRNSLYKIIYDRVKPAKATNDLTIREKMFLSGTVGGIAAITNTPFSVISIRQMIDTQIRK
jgi:hypothetical protein